MLSLSKRAAGGTNQPEAESFAHPKTGGHDERGPAALGAADPRMAQAAALTAALESFVAARRRPCPEPPWGSTLPPGFR